MRNEKRNVSHPFGTITASATRDNAGKSALAIRREMVH